MHLVPYDETWPARFETERAVLLDVLGPWLVGPVEHIGSTSVPGLLAKPVIDIMAGVEALDASRDAIQVLEQNQYCYFEYRAHIMHWFCKPSPSQRTHHLHLVVFESPLWKQRLAFRNRLRHDASVATEYANLKQRLAREHEFDRDAYTDAKEPFVRRIVEDTLGPTTIWAS